MRRNKKNVFQEKQIVTILLLKNSIFHAESENDIWDRPSVYIHTCV